MNIFLYTILFLIGVLVGNFWKSAIYRIPRNIGLTKKSVSYIEPNKKSTVISQLFYLFIGGILFVIFGKILKINISNINLYSILTYLFTMFYISTLVIIGCIDQKNLKIDKRVVASGIILSILYIIYLYSIDTISININIIYLGIYVILLVADTFIVKRYAENSYTIGILMIFDIILIFTGMDVFFYTLIVTTLEILVFLLISKIRQKRNGNKKVKLSNVPVGYFVTVSNIITLIMISVINQ